MTWNDKTKEIVSYVFASIMFIFGIGLVIWGFVTPPVGEVHASVQLLFGQSIIFVAAVLGISLHYDNKSKIMYAELEQKLEKKIHDEVDEAVHESEEEKK